MSFRKLGAWCGGVWSNEHYPKDNPPQAPHVLLKQYELGHGPICYAASLVMAGPEGVPGAKTLGVHADKVRIPKERLPGPHPAPIVESPIEVHLTRPVKVFETPFALPNQPLWTVER